MFDLNILFVGQRDPTVNIPGNRNIWIVNTNENYKKKKKYYYKIAPTMNYLDGIWYSLLCSEDELGGTVICDYADNTGIYPYWVSAKEIQDDLHELIIQDDYLESFLEIIKYLLKCSPIQRIALLCRYQSHDEVVICGALSLSNFISLLSQKKIMTNTCYFIKSDF
ncbi:hypothetical protein SDC9_106483 [bioreactor metagenome]|uniref:Uncharacterized protein n=1 Tax=bioreactor metagenome TaxID=1076179 RepID=A0A645B2L4_9ZZZZ|nr:hypothetical protein [Oscillospiraceae bacterium]